MSILLKSYTTTILMVLLFHSGFNQDKTFILDSLNSVIEDENSHDTSIVNCYLYMGTFFVDQNPDTTYYMIEKALVIAEKNDYKLGLADCYGWLGYLNDIKGNISEAIDYNLKSLQIIDLLDYDEGYPTPLNNLGHLHSSLHNYDQAIKYYNEAIVFNTKLNREKSLGSNYNNLGLAYREMGNYPKSLEFHHQAIQLRTRINDKKGLTHSYSNIGSTYEDLHELDTALFYYLKASKLNREINHKRGLATTLYKSANIYLVNEKDETAKKLALEALEIAIEIDYLYQTKESAKVLYKLEKRKGNTKSALSYFEIYSSLHDSLNSLDNQKAVLKSQYQFEYNQKALIDSLEKDKIIVENQLLEEKNRLVISKNSIQKLWLTISILGLIILISTLYFYRKSTIAKMEGFRSEIKLRLNETLSLKNEIAKRNSTNSSFNLSGLNVVLEDKLSTREQEILDLLVTGLSNKEIGEKLFISVNTIKTHLLSLYNKLDVKNRTQAAVKGNILKIQENQNLI